jgi:hypothetical protein
MGSIFLDLYHILFNLSGFSLLFTLILLALKAPIGVTCMETLKQRGVTLQLPTMPTMANFQGGGGGGYQRAEQGEASTSSHPFLHQRRGLGTDYRLEYAWRTFFWTCSCSRCSCSIP